MKLMSLSLFILVCSLFIMPFNITKAQSKPLECTLSNMKEGVDLYIEKLGELKTETDPVKIAFTMERLFRFAGTLRALCDNLSFHGKLQKVIGPVKIPPGMYRAIITTKGFISVNVTTIDGECGKGDKTHMNRELFSLLDEGQAKDGAEIVFTSTGCTTLIEISNVVASKAVGADYAGEWSLSFEIIPTD